MARRLTRDQIIHAFDKQIAPVTDLEPGEVLTLETLDAGNGLVTSNDFDAETLRSDRSNPATGPIRIPGAEPGDVLVVDILDIRLADQGFMAVKTGVTAVANRFQRGDVKIVPIRDGYAILTDTLSVPIHPMIGVIGVAPLGEPVGNLYGGDHGGNMDTRTITIGSRVYLPVYVSGAMLAIGDIHAAQGEGEIFLSAVEISSEVDIRVQVAKGVSMPTPIVETADTIAPIATGSTLDAAADGALNKAFDLLTGMAGMDFFDAGRLISIGCHLMISQYVPPAVIHGRVDIPKSHLRQLKIDLPHAPGTP